MELGLHFPFACRGDMRLDLGRVAALARSRLLPQLRRVYCGVPSWNEQPSAADWLPVRWLRDACEHNFVPFYWCRQRWVSFAEVAEECGNPLDNPLSLYDVAGYAAAISNVRTEARALGCQSGLHMEPYGDSPLNFLKARDLKPREIDRARCAVAEAVDRAGQVDVVGPYGGRRPGRYPWAFGELGEAKQSTILTYYADSAEMLAAQGREPQPPPGLTWDATDWRAYVKPKSVLDEGGLQRLTESQILAMDMSAIQAVYPSMRRVVLSVAKEDFETVMNEWGQ